MGNNPSRFTGDDLPVETVSWTDAVAFCEKLNEMKRDTLPAGYHYTLPTEAQREYACRAGTTKRFSYGNDTGYIQLGSYAWYDENSSSGTHPVGEKLPNDWGLYDMHGNVWEWCLDWYDEYPEGSITDPQGPQSGTLRVDRGGSWSRNARICRSADRDRGRPVFANYDLGFRVALSSTKESPRVTGKISEAVRDTTPLLIVDNPNSGKTTTLEKADEYIGGRKVKKSLHSFNSESKLGLVKFERVNVRTQPGIMHEVFCQVNKGDKVRVLETIHHDKPFPGNPRDWYRIKIPENVVLWVASDYIDPTDQTVTASRLNARAGPSESYTVVVTLYRGYKVERIQETGGWTAIKPPAKIFGYVYKGHIDLL